MSIFKESFNPNIQSSLEARQILMGKTIRTPQELIFLNSNTSWVSLKSSVDLNDDKGVLAQNNVLIGGTLNDSGSLRYGADTAGNGAYSTKTSNGKNHVLGMRPMPGITSIEIKNKGAYGSTRIATVNFQCWDVEQLNIMEALYMRPGYTVLLEFGRNNYIDENGLLKQVSPKNDFFTKKNVILSEYLNELYNRSIESKGNYDALFGYIINYGWAARNDGGYDCRTEIVTTGEILESLKVNYTVGLVDFSSTLGAIAPVAPPTGTTPAPPSTTTKTNKPKFTGLLHDPVNVVNNNAFEYPYLTSYARVNEEYSKNILSGLIFEIFRLCNKAGQGSVSYSSGAGTTITPPNVGELKFQSSVAFNTTSSINYALINYNSTANTDPEYKNIKSVDQGDVYITLESFIKLINKYIMPKNPDSGGTLTRLSVYDRGYLGKGDQPLYCLYHPLMVSVNPDAVFVKNDKWVDILSNIKVDQNWIMPEAKDVNTASGFIENPNMTALVRKILKEFEYPETFAFPAASRILKEIGDRGVKSKLSSAAFAKQFNEHYVWVRGGLESVDRENNTYTFYNFKDGGSVLERKLEKMASNLTRTFKLAFNDFITPVSDADFNIITDKKIQEYAKAVYNYNYSDSATIQLETFLNNEVKLEEQRQQTQKTVNTSNAAAGGAGTWWYTNVYEKLKQPFIYTPKNKNQRFGIIGNIYLNTKFLFKMAKDPSLMQQDASGKQSLQILNYIKAIMHEVQTSLGNVNNFEIIIDDRDGIGRIVDLNYVNAEKEELFKFEIGSNNSIIKDIKIESEISNNMTSMIAIAAQSSAGAFGLDNSTLVSYNTGILDRVIPKKDSPIYSLGNSPVNIGVKITSFTEALSVIAKFFLSFGGKDPSSTTGNFDAQNTESNKNALREIISFFTSIKDSSNQNKAFLPTKISLTIDGLSGIVIGNLFNVDKTFLPTFYKGSSKTRDVGYIVVNVGHSLSNNIWNTNIQGFPFIIEKNPLKDDEEYEIKLIVDYDSTTNSITVNIDNISNKNLKGVTRSIYNKEEANNPGFQQKVKEVAAALNTTEDALIALFKAESGIDSTNVNNLPTSPGATGLIQFMPDKTSDRKKFIANLAKSGTGLSKEAAKLKARTFTYTIAGQKYSGAQLQDMGAVKQLDLVKAYFNSAGFKGQRPIGFLELYGVTFVPAMFDKGGILKPDNYILPYGDSKPGIAADYARDNHGIADFGNRTLNGKKVIDIATFKIYCNNALSKTFI
jgi:hypothetical protein